MKFTELLSEYRIDYTYQHHHVTEGWIGIDCPHCSRDSKRYLMGYNVASGALNCWQCSNHNLFQTLVELTGESFGKVKQLIGSLERVYSTRHHKPTGKLKLPKGLGPLGQAHIDYLTRRGLDPDEIVELWGIQATSLAPKLPWRIWIPITLRGQLISWTTRSIAFPASKSPLPRYICAKASESTVSIRNVLYGADFVRHAVCVVEGPISAWSIGYGAVATLGVGYSHEQLRLISQYPTRYICMDAEPKAQLKARKLCSDLSVFPGKTVNIVLESGKDANEANRKEIKELRRMLV